MNVIRTELSELSAHYLKKLIFDFVYSISSVFIDQSAPNLGKYLCPTEFE